MQDNDSKNIFGVYTQIQEDLQRVKLTTDTAIKTLIAHTLNDPKRFFELLKKTPSLYGAMLVGNLDRMREIFKEMGVDIDKIDETVAKSMELFKRYQRGEPVEIRKGTKVAAIL